MKYIQYVFEIYKTLTYDTNSALRAHFVLHAKTMETNVMELGLAVV
jgi:hypothetical protein